MTEQAPPNAGETSPIVRSVDSFTNPKDEANPLNYPGERPKTSYLTDGSSVFPLELITHEGSVQFVVRSETGVKPINEVLAELGVEALENRYPITSYGANVSPVALRKKLTATTPAGDPNDTANIVKVPVRPDLLVVPTVYGNLHGYDVVWHGEPGQKGNYFAELYKGPETTDTKVSAAVSFLTAEQLLILHATEAAYDLGIAGRISLENGITIPAMRYVGTGTVLLENGHPVAVAGISADNRQLRPMTSAETLTHVLELPEVNQALQAEVDDFKEVTPDVENYIAAADKRDLDGRKALQKVVAGVLSQLGLLKQISDLDASDTRILSRANPSTLPTLADIRSGNIVKPDALIRMPEQETIGLINSTKRAIVLRALRRHHHNLRAKQAAK